MDLLDCQTRSRCHECHHFSASGCALLAALEAYESSVAPRPTRPAREPVFPWADTRGSFPLAEA